MWQTIRLGDVCTISSSKRIFAKEYQTEGIPFYRGKEVIEKHNGNKVSTELFISPKRYEEIKGKYEVPKKGDILLTSVGTLGIPWLVDEDDFYFKDGNLTWLRCNTQILPSYLYLWLNSAEAQNQIDVKCIGSTQKALTIETLNKFQITLPSLELQKKIVAVINPIESSININRSVNENLEQQISSIYANFCESKSWKPCELGSIIDVKDGTHDSPKPQTSGYLLVTSKHLLPYGVDRITPNRITEKDFKKINERSLVEQGDVLMSMIGTIGLISFVTEREIDYAIKNVALFKTSRTPNLAYYFLTFLKSNKTQQYIEMCLAGSTQKYISLGELRKMPIPVPDSETLECFNEIVSPMYQAIILNSKENYAFAALRDLLLPKLMSGEIDVSKIDI